MIMAAFGMVPQDPAAGAELLSVLSRVGGRVTFVNIQPPQKQEGLKRFDRQWKYYEVKGNGGGQAIAILVVAENPQETVTVMLPDGRVAMQLWNQRNRFFAPTEGLTADGQQVRNEFIHGLSAMCTGKVDHFLIRGTEPFLEIPGHKMSPFVWPFVIGTFCLGACCVHCLFPYPKVSKVLKAGAEVGTITFDAKRSFEAVAQDPEVLAGLILMMGLKLYNRDFPQATA